MPKKNILSDFLSYWVLSLITAISWLLTDRYLPWAAFYSDAWMVFPLVAGMVYVVASRWLVILTPAVVWGGFLIVVVVFQGALGLILISGTAVVSILYIFAFVLALVVGASVSQGKSLVILDFLFFSIGVAAILSVGVSLKQRFGVDGLPLLTMEAPTIRVFANLGQPNQLATLLLMGLIAIFWGVEREVIGSRVAVFSAGFILFAVALTYSRTAWLGVLWMAALVYFWGNRWRFRCTRAVALSLLGYFFILVVLIYVWDNFEYDPKLWDQGEFPLRRVSLDSSLLRLQGESRWRAWGFMFEALLQRPWFGFGFNQTVLAQWQVVDMHPHPREIFTYAHNIFLDLILWLGIPLGLCFSTFLIHRVWIIFVGVKSSADSVIFLVLVVLLNHSMLEFPLYYAYFLIPFGLFWGVLEMSVDRVHVVVKSGVFYFFALLVLVVFFVVLLDYRKIEVAHRDMRLLRNGIALKEPAPAPDVLVLNQLSDLIYISRLPPTVNMSDKDISRAEKVLLVSPDPFVADRLLLGLKQSGNMVKFEYWLNRSCLMFGVPSCQYFEKKYRAAR